MTERCRNYGTGNDKKETAHATGCDFCTVQRHLKRHVKRGSL